MVLKPKLLRMAINGLAKKLLEHKSAKIRSKAAQSLSEFGSDKAIPFLCEALNQEEDENVLNEIIDAIMLINKLNSSPSMSEPSKYNISNPQNVQIVETTAGGDAVIHKYAQQQNLTEAAKEIQDLIQYLQQTNPTTTEEEAVKQVIKNNQTLKNRLLNALKQGGTEALKTFFPFVSIPLETIRGFIEAE